SHRCGMRRLFRRPGQPAAAALVGPQRPVAPIDDVRSAARRLPVRSHDRAAHSETERLRRPVGPRPAVLTHRARAHAAAVARDHAGAHPLRHRRRPVRPGVWLGGNDLGREPQYPARAGPGADRDGGRQDDHDEPRPRDRQARAARQRRGPLSSGTTNAMTLTDALELFAYNKWANDRTLASLEPISPDRLARDLGSSLPTLIGTAAHIAGAEWVGLERWRGGSPTAQPDWTKQ